MKFYKNPRPVTCDIHSLYVDELPLSFIINSKPLLSVLEQVLTPEQTSSEDFERLKRHIEYDEVDHFGYNLRMHPLTPTKADFQKETPWYTEVAKDHQRGAHDIEWFLSEVRNLATVDVDPVLEE